MNELKKMIEDFLNGEYDALDFSYDLPDFLMEHHQTIGSGSAQMCIGLLQTSCPIFAQPLNEARTLALLSRWFGKNMKE